MPIYRYYCEKCGKVFGLKDNTKIFTSKDDNICMTCGSKCKCCIVIYDKFDMKFAFVKSGALLHNE